MRSSIRLFLKIILVPFAAPVVFLMRIIRPLIYIRIGNLECSRIGHFASQTEFYLCKRDREDGEKKIDIFYCVPPVCNTQLKIMWGRVLHMSKVARYVDSYNRMMPGGKKHVIVLPQARDTDGFLIKTPVHLSFTPEEEQIGIEALKNIGLPDNADFICFHTRDSKYLANVYPDSDCSSHDFRDSSIRDYIPAIEGLVKRGHYMVRMGAVVDEKLDFSHPLVIDYSLNGRSDFLDIYLSAKCRFFICSTAGIWALPTVFRRPVVFVNLIPLEYAPTWGANDLFIPKKLWLKKEDRLMTFREIIMSGTGRFLETDEYKRKGIEVLDNTPEEILDIAVEMDERLKGTWQTTDEDEELQRRFWEIFKGSYLHGPTVSSRVGAVFLRQNKLLLNRNHTS